MIAQRYTPSRLVRELRVAIDAGSDPQRMLAAVAPLARRLATSPGWVRAAHYRIDPAQGIGITVLHEAPERDLLVETVAWAPQRGVRPHDHQTWGVVAGIDGAERNVLWRRLDDGSRGDRATLERLREVVVGPGDVIGFMPDDIHSVHNDSERISLSLHVYGRDLARLERNEFDPERGLRRACPKRARRAANAAE